MNSKNYLQQAWFGIRTTQLDYYAGHLGWFNKQANLAGWTVALTAKDKYPELCTFKLFRPYNGYLAKKLIRNSHVFKIFPKPAGKSAAWHYCQIMYSLTDNQCRLLFSETATLETIDKTLSTLPGYITK